MLHRSYGSAVALVALLLLLVPTGAPTVAAQETGDESPYGLANRPPPSVTGAELVDMLTSFVDTYPYRITGTPHEILAAQFLLDEATDLGYEAEIRYLPAHNAVAPAGGTPPVAV